MEKLRITPEEAAPLLGISPGQIRNLMRRDYIKKMQALPIGRAYPANGSRRNSFRYVIYKPLVLKFVGRDTWPGEEQEK